MSHGSEAGVWLSLDFTVIQCFELPTSLMSKSALRKDGHGKHCSGGGGGWGVRDLGE